MVDERDIKTSVIDKSKVEGKETDNGFEMDEPEVVNLEDSEYHTSGSSNVSKGGKRKMDNVNLRRLGIVGLLVAAVGGGALLLSNQDCSKKQEAKTAHSNSKDEEYCIKPTQSFPYDIFFIEGDKNIVLVTDKAGKQTLMVDYKDKEPFGIDSPNNSDLSQLKVEVTVVCPEGGLTKEIARSKETIDSLLDFDANKQPSCGCQNPDDLMSCIAGKVHLIPASTDSYGTTTPARFIYGEPTDAERATAKRCFVVRSDIEKEDTTYGREVHKFYSENIDPTHRNAIAALRALHQERARAKVKGLDNDSVRVPEYRARSQTNGK